VSARNVTFSLSVFEFRKLRIHLSSHTRISSVH